MSPSSLPAGCELRLGCRGLDGRRLDRGRLDRGHAVLRMERVLLVGVRLRRRHDRRDRLGGAVRRRAGELEEHGGDVVLAALVVRRADQRARGRLEVAAVAHDDLRDRVAGDHRREPVRAEQEDVAGLSRDREDVHVDVRVGAERARDHRALRVHLGLLRRELAAADELGHERVVVGELLELAVAQQVRARVADVPDRDEVVAADERDGHRRAHPGDGRVVRGPVVDAAVRLADQAPDELLGLGRGDRLALRERARERGRGDRRGDLAGLRAAHPVRDGEEGRLADERVLVAAPLAAGVRCRRSCGRAGSSLEPQVGLADADDVAGRQLPLARESDAVDEGAVGRADVLDVEPVAARLEARVAARRVLVLRDRDVVAGAAADTERREVELEHVSLLERWAAGDDEPADVGLGRDRQDRGRLVRAQDHGLLRQPQVARGGADDAPDEEVEEDEERDLERDQRALDLRRGELHLAALLREHDLGGAEREACAVLEREPLQPPAGHLDPVRGVEVDEREGRSRRGGPRRAGATRSGRGPGGRSPSSGRGRASSRRGRAVRPRT